MKNTLHYHFKRLHHHIKKHHRKYLVGIFGGFAVVKLFALVLGLSVIEYTTTMSTFAQLTNWCVLTGQYYTGEYQTWGYITWQTLTSWYQTWCTIISWYRTWGALDESGTLTWQTRVEESQTWCLLTGQELTGWYLTWYYLTWGYRTWGYITWCLAQIGTNQTWTNQTWTNLLWNSICESNDIAWNAPVAWSVVRNIVPISWSYSWTDCLSWLSLQLWDHNNQRVTLKILASGTTWYVFNSNSLYSFQQSGLYHIVWTGTSGQYYLYTGIATGTYSRLFSWYKLRLLTTNQTSVYETPTFIINNILETSSLTWITLLANGLTTWYLTTSGVVTLNFTANQLLTWLRVTLWSGKLSTTSSFSWLSYTYTRTLSSWYIDGPLFTTISFVDTLWATLTTLYTWSLVFDATVPVVSSFVFSGYNSWVYLNFSWSEPVRYVVNYRKTGAWFITGSTTDYLTSQQYIFSWIDRGQQYMFTMDIYDRAGNKRSVKGDVLQTTLWTILSHVNIVPLAITVQESATWTLASLAVVLKAEVGKFNTCKNALSYTPIQLNIRDTIFTLEMPMFQKSQMKTLVNAFTLFVLDKIKNNPSMASGDIDQITKKFDNFLVILKLLRDDDNVCKQNLSNYHISQFQRILEEYNISLE